MFKVKWEKKAQKEIYKFPKSEAKQLILKTRNLNKSPMKNSFPLSGCNYRKIRAGDYRAIIEVISSKKLVKVLLVGHRKNIYKKFFRNYEVWKCVIIEWN